MKRAQIGTPGGSKRSSLPFRSGPSRPLARLFNVLRTRADHGGGGNDRLDRRAGAPRHDDEGDPPPLLAITPP